MLVERDGNMKQYFGYELTLFPTSLFDNGMMRKPNKSNLAKALKEGLNHSVPVRSPYHVIDGGALLHKVKWLPNSTYQSIISQYTNNVMKKYGISCVVFDGYENGPYIKDHEHKRRVGKSSANINIQLQMEATCSQDLFLKNTRNKTQFISLLSEALRQENHDVRNSDGDADTQIVNAALQYASNSINEVVVVAADTDILVLLMFHWRAGMNVFLLNEGGKKQGNAMWKIEDLVNSAGTVITEHILFIHAWTGCDTTSALYGRGKTAILKKFGEDDVYIEAAAASEDENATHEEIQKAGVSMALRRYL